MILTGLTACDNVEWGGVEFRLQAPSTQDAEAASAGVEADAGPPPLEVDPALYLVDRSEAEPRLAPVALLGPEGLQPFAGPADVADFPRRFARERMEEGRRFILFANGTRVGSFYARSGSMVTLEPVSGGEPAEPEQGTRAVPSAEFGFRNGAGPWCSARPTVAGWIEVDPDLPAAIPLLALPVELASGRPHGSFVQPTSDGDHRTAALNVASALFQSEEMVWPPDVVQARADMQVFRIPGSPVDFVASTFLYGDVLAAGPAPPNAYSLFFIGEPAGEGRYIPSYFRYREVGSDRKGAPRFVGHADWDGDGREDVLLEVFGERGRWFAALSREDDGWTETYSEGCAPPSGGSMARGEMPGARVAADTGF